MPTQSILWFIKNYNLFFAKIVPWTALSTTKILGRPVTQIFIIKVWLREYTYNEEGKPYIDYFIPKN